MFCNTKEIFWSYLAALICPSNDSRVCFRNIMETLFQSKKRGQRVIQWPNRLREFMDTITS